MERYESYKDSGVKWIGEIPEHWEVKRFRFIFSENKNKNLKLLEKNQLQFKYGEIVSKDRQDISDDIKKILSNYSVVQEGDIMINGLNLNYDFVSQRVAIVREKGVITSAYISLRARNGINSKFYNYFMKAMDCHKMFHGMGSGIRLTLSYDNLKNLFFPCPKLSEQTAIANYLDSVMSKIDEAISQQQKMIDLLNERKQIIIQNAVTKGLDPNAKMKDSGVEWIGEIPEDWEVKKLKHVCQAFGRIGFRGYSTTDLVDEGEGCITLSPSNMRNGQMQYEKCTYLSWEKYEESPEIKIHNGDILFVKTGSTYGKSSLVEDLPLEATINPQLLVFKNFTCNNKFLVYVLQTTTIKTQVELSVIGGTIPTISQQKILNYVFPYPTVNVQDDIVAFIENKTTPISEAIKVSERQIALLQERKQIIINDVVTGKVKVL